ncbi:MAG: ABC transporter ATP-binding protein [Acholeplasmatales bacterium]|jgi:putative ABC transport system ATP-binding protein|nr:ABC transporter ATP-binding protein [Acholeplasmatales bacterium]
MGKIVEFKNVNKTYKSGSEIIYASKDLSFSIEEGETCLILGPSGSGKTTALNLLGGMDYPTNGEIKVDNYNLEKLPSKELTLFRRNHIGFVFQFYNLMPNLNALENIELATELNKKNALDSKTVLKLVGLEDREKSFPSQLSGGEQQRVSIARAIAKNPNILLCDEPTGALDYNTGKQIFKIIFNLVKQEHKTLVVVSHNVVLKDVFDHVIYIHSGSVSKNEYNDNPLDIDSLIW